MSAEKYVHRLAHFYDSIREPPETMRFEIVVAPSPLLVPALPAEPQAVSHAHPGTSGPVHAGGSGPSPGESRLHVVRRGRARPPRHLFDVFVDGANVTARVRESHGVFVLRDLALALVDLDRRPRAKRTVHFYDEPWEMCVERSGPLLFVSMYRTGSEPQVTLYDRAVPFHDVVGAVRIAIDRVLSTTNDLAGASTQLQTAAEQLGAIGPADVLGGSLPEEAPLPEPVQVVVDLDRDAPLAFGAEFTMRDAASPLADNEPEPVERADLHALLFRGRLRAEVRGHSVDLGECHPLLVAERLVEIARRAFDAWERGLAVHARGETAGVLLGVRITSRGELALTLGAARNGEKEPRSVHTFPALGATDLLEAALSFGRALVRAILRHDRAQANNLRLGPFRDALREASALLREARQTDSKVNPTPEPYRAFAAALDSARPRTATSPPAARLRYTARWRAVVPGIDLRGTYLCGDRLIAGSASEMWALDRSTGRVLWRSDVARGTSVITPGGVARLTADGQLHVYDLLTGQLSLRTQIAPRVGGPVAGAVVHFPGLPRLVIVTEGDHHLVAVDLTTGDLRWRWSWGGARAARRGRLSGAPRLKRVGRLIYFTCGDGALTALDVMTGSVVWRLRDRLRFRTPPTVVGDTLFVVAGGAHGIARLYCVDPYSGRMRWSKEIAESNSPCTIEGPPLVASRAVAVALRQKTGLKLVAFDRETGARVAARAQVVAPSGTSWLAVDDAFVGNAPTGELVAVDATSGDLRWRQVLGSSPLEADVPRRLEPVLRCGALFVPHAEIAVVRPRDGAVLGVISPSETIPDLMRVDERCDVFVAEESGHLVAFGALPRLSLVRA